MGVSTHLMRRFGILLLTAVGAVGCAQLGDTGGALPTSPSSLSAGPVAFSETDVFTTMAGPGASYDVDGTTWRIVVYNGASPNAGIDGDFETVFTQDSDGNITFVDDDGNTITLTRLGTGVINTYRISFVADTSPCDFELSGVVRLDTRTNTGNARVRITTDDCSQGVQFVTLTKF